MHEKAMDQSEAKRMMIYDAQKKSPVVAYLLWWFLGMFGAHRLYLGKTGSGVAMLVTTLCSIVATLIVIGFVGLFVVWICWIVDAFLIPSITRRSNMRLADRL